MVGHGGSSASSYLADPTSPIPSHCASVVTTSTVRVNPKGDSTVWWYNKLTYMFLHKQGHWLLVLLPGWIKLLIH